MSALLRLILLDSSRNALLHCATISFIGSVTSDHVFAILLKPRNTKSWYNGNTLLCRLILTIVLWNTYVFGSHNVSGDFPEDLYLWHQFGTFQTCIGSGNTPHRSFCDFTLAFDLVSLPFALCASSVKRYNLGSLNRPFAFCSRCTSYWIIVADNRKLLGHLPTSSLFPCTRMFHIDPICLWSVVSMLRHVQ